MGYFAGVVFETERDGEGEVGPCRKAGEGYSANVEAEVVCVGGEVEEGIDGVINGCRKRVLWCKAVGHTNEDAGYVLEDGGCPIAIVEGGTKTESAAVKVDDEWVLVASNCTLSIIFRSIKIYFD